MSRLDMASRQGYPSTLRAPRVADCPVHTREYSLVPNIASAKKNMRKSRAAAVRNRAQRSALRTALKKARTESGSAEVTTFAVSLLDRAARKGLIHKNKAARHKRQLAKAAAAQA
jgi:small subunit ribosomal protein S20